jgi:hypothetical protein
MPTVSRVFVVHVWAEDQAFRARARAAEAEQPRDFDDPQALVDFLHHGATPTSAPTTPLPAAPAPTPREPT